MNPTNQESTASITNPNAFADEQIPPDSLAAAIRTRLTASASELSGFWFQVLGNRSDYARELQEHLAGDPVVVLVVRRAPFDNVNAVLDDFVVLLEENQEVCEKHLVGDAATERRAVVLLARNTLQLPQISSPVILPAWFPRLGGRTASVIIEDLTWRAESPLNVAGAAIGDLCQLLFDLEGALLERLQSVCVMKKAETDSFWDQVHRGDKEVHGSFADFLDGVRRTRHEVHNPTSYRPSVREGSSLVARIWGKAQATSPDGLGKVGKALARALALPESVETSWHRSMVAVLFRPSSGPLPEQQAFATNILVTIGAACQMITAASHADAYPSYPVPLIRSMSFDLRQGLAGTRRNLIALDHYTG
ncbi:hypothetical protein K4B79_14580 [Streptomyces lincolnensis]|uniref:hypothetical protein n=1 Tax=Streptomyces lincolnensis TaxID=1915 RepID=UPI001E52361D|nr:hypothetical protein [Streptomyces lincolnensis]MCD7439454.1 hypothetical protein [Streptomyces lincolnensis]